MFIIKDFIIFIIGLAVIYKSADFFTDGASGIALVFRIPRLIIGLTIVSFATTAPEFTVSTISTHLGYGGMAVGNAVGSCLANIGLILALAAIIRPIIFQRGVIRTELMFLIGSCLFLYLFMADGVLSFTDGVLLTASLIAVYIFIVARQIKLSKSTSGEIQEKHSLKKDVFKFLIGAVGVVIAAKYAIIPSGVNIARYFNVPEIVIGLSMVAIGTSLPELFTAFVASAKNMGELAAGNIIGANILNILWVLGFSSMINPLAIDSQTKFVTMPVMLGITIVMALFAATKLKLSRLEGAVLFFIYAGYIIYLFRFAY